MNLSLLAFFVCYVYAIIHQIKDDSIRLQYELTEDKSHVIISVRALAESSKDWVGFGIQPDGEMNDMDMVLAYIEGTSEYSIGNYYISNDDEQPQKNELDAIKNAKVSKIIEDKQFYTVVEFEYPVKATNGLNYDIDLNGPNSIVLAVGKRDEDGFNSRRLQTVEILNFN